MEWMRLWGYDGSGNYNVLVTIFGSPSCCSPVYASLAGGGSGVGLLCACVVPSLLSSCVFGGAMGCNDDNVVTSPHCLFVYASLADGGGGQQ